LTIGRNGVPCSEVAGLPAIEMSGISVRYTITSDRIRSFKEYIIRRATGRLQFRELWALRDVDLSIGIGETFGVVGQNGAGKSTLLKIVSRVMRPSAGRVVVRGRVAPLLELGAGFHPDLTGRENVFLNGMLLGYPRAAVEENFDRVIDFAELRDFVHLPIRNYSSGMVARLGFAVATMLRPDILILDEVLAVGDSRFQEKCLDRIGSFRAQGSTILLVSHNLHAIAGHTTRSMWMDHGELKAIGPTEEVLERYRRAEGLSPRS
jgi:ABC-2 type transport system ATP-binding protein/lipopolysaccharide transport system ATP-binding protein